MPVPGRGLPAETGQSARERDVPNPSPEGDDRIADSSAVSRARAAGPSGRNSGSRAHVRMGAGFGVDTRSAGEPFGLASGQKRPNDSFSSMTVQCFRMNRTSRCRRSESSHVLREVRQRHRQLRLTVRTAFSAKQHVQADRIPAFRRGHRRHPRGPLWRSPSRFRPCFERRTGASVRRSHRTSSPRKGRGSKITASAPGRLNGSFQLPTFPLRHQGRQDARPG